MSYYIEAIFNLILFRRRVQLLHRVARRTTELHGDMELNKITENVIGAAIEVHRQLGPGLLESAYQECLYYELTNLGLNVVKEVPQPIVYKEIELNQGYRLDLLVEGKIVIETKTVECLNDVHFAQLLTYLKLENYKLGLLMNFNVDLLKNGIKRIIN